MHITLSPQVREGTLVVHKYQDTLVINSEEFDFSRINEGDVLPSSAITNEFFTGNVTRVNGELLVNLILPVKWNAPESAMFPGPIENAEDGLILNSEDYYEH